MEFHASRKQEALITIDESLVRDAILDALTDEINDSGIENNTTRYGIELSVDITCDVRVLEDEWQVEGD